MAKKISDSGNTYRIRLKGVPDHSDTDWFGNLTILPQENGDTLLIGPFADQAALRGFLDQLWNLNFTILSVERIEDPNAQSFSQEAEERGE